MNIRSPLYMMVSLSCLCAPVLAQYEDVTDFPDAPTRTREKEGLFSTLEGVQFMKKEGTNEGMRIHFLLTEKPSVYFNYYDAAKKAIVFDFYDTRMGESLIDPIHVSPIVNSTVEFFKLDLNKDVAGLKPDIRDVVRVSLFTSYDLEYELQEDVGVITMAFKWNKKEQQKFASKKNAIYWQFPLALAAIGGGGYAIYAALNKSESTAPADFLPTLPPAHPAP